MSSDFEKRVIAIQGNPVSSSIPFAGQYLGWDGSQWTPSNLPSSLPPSGGAGGDLSGSYPNPIVINLSGNADPRFPNSSTLIIPDSQGSLNMSWQANFGGTAISNFIFYDSNNVDFFTVNANSSISNCAITCGLYGDLFEIQTIPNVSTVRTDHNLMLQTGTSSFNQITLTSAGLLDFTTASILTSIPSAAPLPTGAVGWLQISIAGTTQYLPVY